MSLLKMTLLPSTSWTRQMRSSFKWHDTYYIKCLNFGQFIWWQKVIYGAGEVVRQLRTVNDPAEDFSTVSKHTQKTHSSFGGSDTALGIHMGHTRMQEKHLSNKINLFQRIYASNGQISKLIHEVSVRFMIQENKTKKGHFNHSKTTPLGINLWNTKTNVLGIDITNLYVTHACLNCLYQLFFYK